jgi:hypothetical protein
MNVMALVVEAVFMKAGSSMTCPVVPRREEMSIPLSPSLPTTTGRSTVFSFPWMFRVSLAVSDTRVSFSSAAARRTLSRPVRFPIAIFETLPMAPFPLVRGPLAAHPLAARFVEEVHRIHVRYAAEVVAANRLCPFLRDVETGFGRFCVVLDPREDPDVGTAVEAILAAASPVIHVVYPLIRPVPSAFERFSGRVNQALKKALPDTPVMATFHPALVGAADDPHRLVGLLRRAPDPFVQLIPRGMNEGGTVFAPLASSVGDTPTPPGSPDEVPAEDAPPADPAQFNFDRFGGASVEPLLALIAEIHAERDARYAPFLEAFGISR